MKIQVVVLLLLTPTTVYSGFYTSMRVGGQHQVGKMVKEAPLNFKASNNKNETPEKRKEDYLEILEKIYASFFKNMKAMKSEDYYLVSPEVMFSQMLPGKKFVDGVFGTDVREYILIDEVEDSTLTNHIPEAEARITKIFADMAQHIRDDVPEVKLGDVKNVEIPYHGRDLIVHPVYATYLDRDFKVIYGSGPTQNGEELEGIPKEYFANPTTLHSYILERYLGGFLRNYPALQKEFYEKKLMEAESRNKKLEADLKNMEEAAPPEPPANPKVAKLNMLFEGSVGWRKIIANKGSKLGVYTGVELFFDFNPNEVCFDKKQCSLKEHAIGLTPFVGIASKENWMLYGLAGVKISFKRIDIQQKPLTKHKTEFELGAGTDYMLTQHIAIGFRYIHTFQSTMKLKYKDNSNLTLKTRSSKFLLTFSYMF